MNSTHKLMLVTTLLIAAVGAGAWLMQQQHTADKQPDYTQVPVMRGDITATVSATGTLNPVNTVQVGSQVSGVIAELHADFNQQVEKGQLIARIDSAVFQAKVAEAQANLKSAFAEAKKAQVDVLDAKRELDRQRNLFEKKLVAENVRDAAQVSYDSAKVEHEVRLAAVAQAEAVLQREEVSLDYSSILAPISGVVISRDVEVGQTVAASLQAPTLFTLADDLTHMQVEAQVDETFIGQVGEGQKVSFSVFAYPGRRFEGRVAQVRLQPVIDAGVVKYNSIIQVDNPDLALKPGMTATVAIQVAQRHDVLQVPASALRFVPDWPQERLDELRDQLESNEHILWVMEGGALRPIKVTTGIQGSRHVEVNSRELREGMTVLIPEKRKAASRRTFGISLF
jgi:HlyD family secretion protein